MADTHSPCVKDARTLYTAMANAYNGLPSPHLLSPADAFAYLITGRSVVSSVYFYDDPHQGPQLAIAANKVCRPFPYVAFCTASFQKDASSVIVVWDVSLEVDLESIGQGKIQQQNQVKQRYVENESGNFILVGDDHIRVHAIGPDFPPVTITFTTYRELPRELPQWLQNIERVHFRPIRGDCEPLRLYTERILQYMHLLSKYGIDSGAQAYVTLAQLSAFRLSLQCRAVQLDATTLFDGTVFTPASGNLVDECFKFIAALARGDSPQFPSGLVGLSGREIRPAEGERTCKRMWDMYSFLCSAVKAKKIPGAMKKLFDAYPDAKFNDLIQFLDDFEDGVHAEMRILLKFGAQRLKANRSCFGIERKCCLACFFVLSEAGILDLDSHGKLFSWPINRATDSLNLTSFPNCTQGCLHQGITELGTLSNLKKHAEAAKSLACDVGIESLPSSDIWSAPPASPTG